MCVRACVHFKIWNQLPSMRYCITLVSSISEHFGKTFNIVWCILVLPGFSSSLCPFWGDENGNLRTSRDSCGLYHPSARAS